MKYSDAIALQDKYDGCWGEVGLNDSSNFNTIVNRLKIKIRYLVRQISENFSAEHLMQQKNIRYVSQRTENTHELQILRNEPSDSPEVPESESS